MNQNASPFGFSDPDLARQYAAGSPTKFFPGMTVLHELTAQLLAETTPREGRILVVGGGGGLELGAFADREPGWRFTAVDPSAEMISAGQANLERHASRIEWIEGRIHDAPQGPFDAATCLLTLHVIPEESSPGRSKRDTLKAINQRLKPGGTLVVVDNCLEDDAAVLDRQLDRYLEQARRSGVTEESLLERIRTTIVEHGHSISARAEEELFVGAGFQQVHLYYAALSWRGWGMNTPRSSSSTR